MIINGALKTSFAFAIFLTTFSLATIAYAHGVVITYTFKASGEVVLHAAFDTGEPLGQAQVTIYAPEDPLTPWLTGTADAEGNYIFVIDPEMPGTWDVQFRKAGHGDIIHFQFEEGMIDPALMINPPGELIAAPPVAKTEPIAENRPDAEPVVLASGGNTGNSGGFTSLQILLMSGSVIWGFVGTALYFSSKKTQAHDHAHGHHH